MAEVEPMKIDGLDKGKPVNGGLGERKRPPKRKRLEQCLYTPSPEEKQAKILGFRSEINSLVNYCKNFVSEKRGGLLEDFEKVGNSSATANGVIACLMEEGDLPLSKLVDEIFEKVKDRTGNRDGFSKASVRSAVLIIGQRMCYGVVSADADVLEDEAECALWCWETRDLKLMPKSVRVSLKIRRTCRRKIQERISAVSACDFYLTIFGMRSFFYAVQRQDMNHLPFPLLPASRLLIKIYESCFRGKKCFCSFASHLVGDAIIAWALNTRL